jgi:hypothetical protein
MPTAGATLSCADFDALPVVAVSVADVSDVTACVRTT